MAVVSDETFSSEELFKRESGTPLRAGKADQTAYERR
jgi:hypothetical protein